MNADQVELILHKYRHNIIGKGKYGTVIKIPDKDLVIKVANSRAGNWQIHNEFRFYSALAPSGGSFAPIWHGRVESGELAAIVLPYFQNAARDLPRELVYLMIAQLTFRLSKFYEANIVHRDVKPANIMFNYEIVRDRADQYLPRFYLIDLGVSTYGEAVPADLLVGTPAFMSAAAESRGGHSFRDDMISLIYSAESILNHGSLSWSFDKESADRIKKKSACKFDDPVLAEIYEILGQVDYGARPPYEEIQFIARRAYIEAMCQDRVEMTFVIRHVGAAHVIGRAKK